MNTHVLHSKSDSGTTEATRTATHRILGIAASIALSALLAGQTHAGGADVSADAVYSDDVVLSTFDGDALDINGDGFADLAVATNQSGGGMRSRYYLGNGDGTFGATVLLPNPGGAFSGAASEIVAGEMNGDAFLDLIQGRRDLTDLLYAGDGTDLADPVAISADAFRTLAVALGDLDNDGDLDIVTGNGRPGGIGGNDPDVNRFYINDGAGNFTAANISADADDTRSIALADMDGDGDLDVIVGNDETTAGSNRVYLNDFISITPGTVSFTTFVEFGPADDQTNKLLIGDLDGDTDLDVVTLNNAFGPSPGVNRFFINDLIPGGALDLGLGNDISADTDLTSGGELADFDGDGDLDLAVANLDTVNRLYLNEVGAPGAAVTFAAGTDISADSHQSRELAAFDIDGDTDIDIVVGNQLVPDRRYLNNGTAAPFTNVAPVITAPATLTTAVDTPITILLGDLTVTDPDNVFPVDFTLAVQAGANYSVSGTTVTPDPGFNGDLTVPVTVNDGTVDSAAFNITVTVGTAPANMPPTFTSVPDLSTVVDEVYTYNIVATDPDVGDALGITAPTLPTWLDLTDNGDGTATLTGTPGLTEVGDHPVSLVVSDGTDTDTQDFTITVELVASNSAPVFESTPVTDATAGVAYSYDIEVSDDDADPLTITAAVKPAWLTLTDNGNGTATLTGTPAAGDVGDHDVTLQVHDGTNTTDQNFTVTVAAGTNTAPTFTSTAVIAAMVGDAYSYSITATDADGDTLTITAPTLPAWLTFTDNGDGTATLTGTPVAADAGDHDVSLEVSDGTDTATQDFTITVEEEDTTPPPPPPRRDSGGGSLGFLSLLALLGFARARLLRHSRSLRHSR